MPRGPLPATIIPTIFSILILCTLSFAGNVIVRNGQLNVSAGIYSDSDTLYIDSENDMVGIGTTSPGYKLDVTSSGEEVFRVQTTKSGDSYYKIFNLLAPNQTDGEAVQISLGHELGSGEVGEIAFFKEASGNYLALGTYGAGNTVAITSSGNVGIGTITPSSKLDVAGNVTLGTAEAHNYLASNALWNWGNFSIKPFSGVTTMGIDFIGSSGDDEQGSIIIKAGGWSGDTSRQWIFRDAYNNGGSPADRLVINVLTGYVGIGTSQPSALLTVSNGIVAAPSDNSTGMKIKVWDSGTQYSDYGIGINSAEFWILRGSNAKFSIYENGETPTADFIIDGSGKVGLGTTSPTNKLHIYGGDLTIEDNVSSPGIELRGPGSRTPFIDFSNGTSEDYDMRLILSAEDNLGILGGNVGIGTSQPSGKLDISDADETVVNIIKSTGAYANQNQSINFQTSYATTGFIRQIGESFQAGSTGGVSDLRLYTNDTEKLRITTGGKIGIGTTSPNSSLHISTDEMGNQSLISLSSDNGWSIQPGINNQLAIQWRDASNVAASIGAAFDGTSVNLYFGSLYNAEYKSWGDNIMIIKGTGKVGINTIAPNDALDVAGDIDATGCVQTDDSGSIGGTCVSDIRLKTNIQPLTGSLERITQLNPVTFQWDPEYYNISSEKGTGVGLIAQELEEIYPELVVIGEDGYKRVRYDIELEMHLIQAVKELKKENSALNAEKDSEIRELQEENKEMKALLCLDHPEAEFCNTGEGGDDI